MRSALLVTAVLVAADFAQTGAVVAATVVLSRRRVEVVRGGVDATHGHSSFLRLNDPRRAARVAVLFSRWERLGGRPVSLDVLELDQVGSCTGHVRDVAHAGERGLALTGRHPFRSPARC